MRIRRFEAPDSKTALAMVKAELGDEAVILANRTISAGGGMPRQYGRTKVEVVAAMDYDLYSIAGYSDVGVEQPVGVMPVTVEEKNSEADRGEVGGDLEKKVAAGEVAVSARRNTLLSKVQRRKASLAANQSSQKGPSNSRATADAPACAGGRNRLTAPGAAGWFRGKEKSKPLAEDVARWREQLIDQIQYHSIFDLTGGSQRIVALVGATGVGKTTTVAKIAAFARLHMGLKVGLVSMDCYRIGATDQLRTYARIMQMSCDVALREKDLPKIIASHADCNLILIDTAGKSPYDEGHVDELSRWFAGVRPKVEPHLTISATTKKEDLKAVFERYRKMQIAGLVLTKLDETRAYATLCQQLAAAKMPVSCLGIGQRVPEDLAQASEEAVGLLFREGWQPFVAKCVANPAMLMGSAAV